MATFAYHSLPSKPAPGHQSPDAGSPSSSKPWVKLFPSLPSRRLLVICTSVFLLVLTPATIILAQNSKSTPPPQHSSRREECGISPSEARNNNCVFDPVLMGWVPWRCHNAPLARDFLAQTHNFTFHRSPDQSSTEITIDEILRGEWQTIYVDSQFYITQCLYTWKKTWGAAAGGSVLDGYLGDEHHTNHCEMLITKGPERERNLYMKYVSCPWGHDGAGRFGWYRVMGGKRVYRADV
ncbi:hypothetical protein QBC34DRAFT_362118 [Podospora aff. communis PSN243]|uniref:Ecp2 effector protein domain-containing protein n=1 Tax=Podospora aff. communis PSN243 TaxID=3040156 RepID=A0AAV9G5N5_9PEZI|nr:hypothetical protein QBC34DRAFT_362118 [Podospora aff. communis PSN243]